MSGNFINYRLKNNQSSTKKKRLTYTYRDNVEQENNIWIRTQSTNFYPRNSQHLHIKENDFACSPGTEDISNTKMYSLKNYVFDRRYIYFLFFHPLYMYRIYKNQYFIIIINCIVNLGKWKIGIAQTLCWKTGKTWTVWYQKHKIRNPWKQVYWIKAWLNSKIYNQSNYHLMFMFIIVYFII